MKQRIKLLLLVVLVGSSFKVYGFRTESQQADKWMQAHYKTPTIWRQQATWHFFALGKTSVWMADAEGFYELPYCEDIGTEGSCQYRNAPKDLQ